MKDGPESLTRNPSRRPPDASGAGRAPTSITGLGPARSAGTPPASGSASADSVRDFRSGSDARFARRLLDRELLVSAAIHDARGPLTALRGWIEMEPGELADHVAPAVGRIGGVLDALARPRRDTPTEVDLGVLLGTEPAAVRLTGPPELLLVALADLPGPSFTWEHGADRIGLHIGDLPGETLVAGGSLEDAEGWIAGAGLPLAGARLRIAGRLVGATHQAARRTGATGEIVLYFESAGR